jgi:Zn-dependent M16 (insulinase) family peptidase
MGTFHQRYRTLESRFVREVNSTMSLLVHEQTNARVVLMQNDDTDKFFTIAFPTYPKDDTGVAHILEHSVLGGSRKYPAKNTFTSLLNSSLNTFANAFTGSDMTGYPVSSTNHRDWENLVSVYLDGVFFPLLHEKEGVFLQEGWRFERDPETGEISRNGVVFNEMKGAFSNPFTEMRRLFGLHIFPDTPYSNFSGGFPSAIPDLTYEQFRAFHQKHYHPSNAVVFLYGDFDPQTILELIDREAFSQFTAIQALPPIAKQAAFQAPKIIHGEYHFSESDDPTGHAWFSMNYVTGSGDDPFSLLTGEILTSILVRSEASPVKLALMERKIGQMIDGLYQRHYQQPVLTMLSIETDPEQFDEFRETVTATLQKLATVGIDPKLIESCVNATEFRLRSPLDAGMSRYMNLASPCLQSMLYGGTPWAPFEYEQHFDRIRREMGNGLFERMIRDQILDNPHACHICLAPKPGLMEQREAEQQVQLEKFLANATPEMLTEIDTKCEILRVFQETPDSKEDLAKIPTLELDALNPKARVYPLVELKRDDCKAFATPVFANGIVYLDLYFDLGAIDDTDLEYASLFATLLGKMDTQRRTYTDFANEESIHTGGVGASICALSDQHNPDTAHAFLCVSTRALGAHMEAMLELTTEALLETCFDDGNRMREVMDELLPELQMRVFSLDFKLFYNRVAASFNRSAFIDEKTGGLEFFKFLQEIAANFEEQLPLIHTAFQRIREQLLQQANCTIDIIGEEADIERLNGLVGNLTSRLGQDSARTGIGGFTSKVCKEAISAPVGVQFNLLGYNILRLGARNNGQLALVQSYLSNAHFYEQIRVRGGAYDASVNITRDGDLYMHGWRDPNLRDTYEVFRKAGEALRQAKPDTDEFKNLVIGAIGALDIPMSPYNQGSRTFRDAISGFTNEWRQQYRDEILSAKPDDLAQWADLIDKVVDAASICTVGRADIIEQDRDLFTEVWNVFE